VTDSSGEKAARARDAGAGLHLIREDGEWKVFLFTVDTPAAVAAQKQRDALILRRVARAVREGRVTSADAALAELCQKPR
jgi:hypothetical protein